MPALMLDRDEQERVVMESPLSWTILKPPRLTEHNATGRYIAGEALKVGMLSSLGRADLAAFMMDIVEGSEFVGKRVFIKSLWCGRAGRGGAATVRRLLAAKQKGLLHVPGNPG